MVYRRKLPKESDSRIQLSNKRLTYTHLGHWVLRPGGSSTHSV
ncbi:hypothetical protein PCAR4_250063 [Paraburkholderia caribensis]|nr:hypothetical protein PCAR4_250063 [Paraburkholderia caribensis]